MAQLKLKNKVRTWQIVFHTGTNKIQMNIPEKEGEKLLKELTLREIKTQPTENKQKTYEQNYKERQNKQ